MVTAFTRSTSGEAKIGRVLWNSFLGMMVAGGRDNARLVRVVNIGCDVGGLEVGVPMTLSMWRKEVPEMRDAERNHNPIIIYVLNLE